MIPSKGKQKKKWGKKREISWKGKSDRRKRMPGGLSRMTELWKLTFLASGTKGCVGPRVVLDLWVVLGFNFWLDIDQKRSNSLKRRLSAKFRNFATIFTFY